MITKSAAINILCIDDIAQNPENARYQNIALLNSDEKLSIELVHPSDLDACLEAEPNYDLIIVDYYLKKVGDFKYHGSALVSRLRQDFPNVPIYLLSADIDSTAKVFIKDEYFDNLISDTWLHQESAIIREIISNYIVVNNSNLQNVADLHLLLMTPEEDKENVEMALPNRLRNINSSNQVSEVSNRLNLDSDLKLLFSRWVTHSLLSVPGILYNSLHAASLLGIDEKYFTDKLASETAFNEAALYSGVFSNAVNKLWWRESIIDYIYSQPDAENNIHGSFTESAASILAVPDDALAICAHCGNPGANTVAYNAGYPQFIHPAHLSCSTQDDNVLPIPYFDIPRVFIAS